MTQDIHSLIDGLSKREREHLAAALAYKDSRLAAVEFSANEVLVWDAINKLMMSRRPLRTYLESCRGSYGQTGFQADADDIVHFLNLAACRIDGGVTRTVRTALVDLAISCLGRYLERAHCPVSHRTLVNNLPKVPHVIDRAFPGYAQAGLLGLAIKKPVAA